MPLSFKGKALLLVLAVSEAGRPDENRAALIEALERIEA